MRVVPQRQDTFIYIVAITIVAKLNKHPSLSLRLYSFPLYTEVDGINCRRTLLLPVFEPGFQL